MAAANEDSRADELAARRRLRECEDKVAKFVAAIESGVDPALIAKAANKAEADRAEAERQLRRIKPAAVLTQAAIRAELDQLRQAYDSLANVLAVADPEDKAAVYAELGLKLTYHPDRRAVSVEATPCTSRRVGERT